MRILSVSPSVKTSCCRHGRSEVGGTSSAGARRALFDGGGGSPDGRSNLREREREKERERETEIERQRKRERERER